MKKIDIIQTTILVIAVLNAYNAAFYVIALLAKIPMASGGFGLEDFSGEAIIALIVVGLVFLLIRYSRRIAAWLLKIDPEADSDTEDSARWGIDRRALIFALFIGIGLFTFIHAVPDVVEELYYGFKSKIASRASDPAPKESDILLGLLRLVVGAFFVYASPSLTDFIEKNIAVRMKTPVQEIPEGDSHSDTPEADSATQSS